MMSGGNNLNDVEWRQVGVLQVLVKKGNSNKGYVKKYH